jgi:hypothetical protein
MAEMTAAELAQVSKTLRMGRTTTPFIEDTDILDGQKEIVTAPLWSNNQSALFNIYTSSAQSSNQKRYYYEVMNTSSNSISAETQFSVTYGDSPGSGSDRGTGNIDDYPTKAIYKQYKQILLNENESVFKFKNEETSEYIYVVNVNRTRFKDRMDTSNWQLSISKLTSAGSSSIGSPADVITLIDDSGTSTLEYNTGANRSYYVRSGSITNGIYTGDTTPWGNYYPDSGIIVLNGKALDASASFNTNRSPSTGSIHQQNALRLFTSISGAMTYNTSSYAFQGRTSEVISSKYYFVRLFNGEHNYSTNPTFITGSFGVLKYRSMINDPVVYITTIGLYDDNANLLAIAKLSKPIAKSFDKEVVVKVKIDY